tara:strand:+ start:134 stop:505 length:372 start_codon:yes stop_codon:yes gene_type:complete
MKGALMKNVIAYLKGLLTNDVSLGQFLRPLAKRDDNGRVVVDDSNNAVISGFMISWRYAHLVDIEHLSTLLSDTKLYATVAKDTSKAMVEYQKEDRDFDFSPTIYLNQTLFNESTEDLLGKFE